MPTLLSRSPVSGPLKSDRHFLIWVLVAILLGVVWLHTFKQIDQDHTATQVSTQNDLANLGRVSQEHAERTIYSIDQTLLMVMGQYREHHGNIDLKAMTDEGVIDSRILHQVAIIDAHGLLQLSNLPLTGQMDLSDREHFKAHLKPGGPALFISRPVLGRNSGKWSIQLSRRMTGKNGAFAGVVVASLDPTYFTRFYTDLKLGKQGVGALFGVDGTVLAMRIGDKEQFVGNLHASPVFTQFAQGSVISTITYNSITDGVERIHHFRKLPSYPLFVAIGMAKSDVFVDHEHTRLLLLWQAGFFTVLLLALAGVASWSLITARRHSAAHRHALLKLQTLTNRAPGLLYQFLMRPDGSSCFPFVSEGIRDIYQVSPEAVALDASVVFAVIHPDDLAQVTKSVRASAKTLTLWEQQYRVRFTDGTVRWLSGKALPERLADGSVIWHGFIFDTTERNQQDMAFLGEQARLRATLDAIPDLLFEAGLDGRVHTYHSPRTELLVAPPENILGKLISEFLPPEAAAVGMAALQEANECGKSSGKQYALDLPPGRMWFELSVARKVAVPGEETRFIALARDITYRKQADAQLRIAATAFRSGEGMCITDAQAVILSVNQAYSNITGYTAEESIGKTPRMISSGRHDRAFYQAMWASITQNGAWQGEIWNRRKNGEIFPEWMSIAAVKDEAGEVTNYVSSLTDITQRKASEAENQLLAFFDPLTGLPNRRLLMDRLKQALVNCTRDHSSGALLFIDLDNFKNINDIRGHDQGDLLLQQVAERLHDCIRDSDTVARLGGDEFVVMLQDLSDSPTEAATRAESVGEKILAALRRPYLFSHYTHYGSASLGVALFNERHHSVDELLRRADLALYQAKDGGRNMLRFFDPDMQAAMTARAELETDLRHGLEDKQFLLYYQPQVDGQGRLTGAEVLVRWLHPTRGMVSPADFIPLAEDTGLILPLGQWVLEIACQQLKTWAAQPGTAHLTLAVNVSAVQFHRENFVQEVLAMIDRTGAPASRLKLELTESMLIKDMESVIAKMLALKDRGVGFSLDDFGTGYSSLSYLKRLPLDQLKIDQSFLHEALTNPKDAAIVRATVALGKNLGLMVIAEGVETQAQRDFLASEGCHNYQGYYFGRPAPVEALDRFFAAA